MCSLFYGWPKIVLSGCTAILAAGSFDLQAQGAAPAATRLQTEARVFGSELVIVNRGGVAKPLVGQRNGWNYFDPVLSPDGKQIAFVSAPVPGLQDSTTPQSEIAVYTLPDGPMVHLETTGRSTQPSWVGTTGDISYFRRDDRSDSTTSMFVRRADGTGSERVILTDEIARLTGSSWLRNGRSFVVTHEGGRTESVGEVLLFSLDRITDPERLHVNNMLPSRPAVNPNGRLVAFESGGRRTMSSGTTYQGSPVIFVVNTSGGSPFVIRAQRGQYPTWSHDGSKLFFMHGVSRLIYVARLRSSSPVAFHDPQVVSAYKIDNGESGFVVLPGDTLFVVRRRKPQPVMAEVSPEVRGARSDIATQKTLELIAARALTSIATERSVDLTQLGVDSRSFVISADPVFAGFPLELSSFIMPFRDSTHLQSLAAILGSPGLIFDTPDCPAPREIQPPCRSGALRGTINFSPVVVSVDSARLYAHAVLSGPTVAPGSASVSISIMHRWAFTFWRRDGEWSVKRIE